MPVLGEGGVMFVLGTPQGPSHSHAAELIACEVAAADGTGAPNLVQCLAQCITKALRQAAISPQEVWAVSGRATGVNFLDEVETQALAAALPQHRPARVLGIGRRLGDTYSASFMFQLAALLAGLKDSSAPKPAYGLVTAVSHGGVAGCALIRAA
jgi:3-oxoacyl-(acyl-carrier-protein) synthase